MRERKSLFDRFDGNVVDAHFFLKEVYGEKTKNLAYGFKRYARRYKTAAKREKDVDKWRILQRKAQFYGELAKLYGGD
ncbi:MAG: hypothetical protein ACE5KE_00685 [Methanosarcinales archaeon]